VGTQKGGSHNVASPSETGVDHRENSNPTGRRVVTLLPSDEGGCLEKGGLVTARSRHEESYEVRGCLKPPEI